MSKSRNILNFLKTVTSKTTSKTVIPNPTVPTAKKSHINHPTTIKHTTNSTYLFSQTITTNSSKVKAGKSINSTQVLAMRGVRYPNQKSAKRRDPETNAKRECKQYYPTNTNRSVHIPGSGHNTFSPIGLILYSDLANFKCISPVDIDSGYGPNKYLNLKKSSLLRNQSQRLKALTKLYEMQKYGAPVRNFGGFYSNHTEALVNIHLNDVQGIYFTREKNFLDTERQYIGDHNLGHRIYREMLQAIYLQHQWISIHKGSLPIYEYSSSHHEFSHFEYQDEHIIQAWQEMVNEYFADLATKTTLDHKEQELLAAFLNNAPNNYLAQFKLRLAIGPIASSYGVEFENLDLHYSKDLKDAIDMHIIQQVDNYKALIAEKLAPQESNHIKPQR